MNDKSNRKIQIEQRIDELMACMTLEEKITLCHGGSKFAVAAIPRLGIPEFRMSDGTHGVRRELKRDSWWEPEETNDDFSTYLPTGSALAATWNPAMARKFGEVLGAEARHRGKDVILGPGINIARTPLCGRNFEYYGEDPCHIARMVVPAVQGIQDQDVAACVKHYAANSQELNRFGVDARMDERTLREIYLPGFKAAVVEGGALTVMGAYNKFRGQYCCQNEHLVNDILKGEWGFDGSYISDWGGVHDTMEAARYGMDIEMGSWIPVYDEYFLAHPFQEAIQRGELPESLLDDKVRRNLRVMFQIGVFDANRKSGERNSGRNRQVALEIAREAIVLLKNEGDVLPLDINKTHKLVVIGENATARHAAGGNSSAIKTPYEVTPLEGLKRKLGAAATIQFFNGYTPIEEGLEPIPVKYLGAADASSEMRGWKATYYPHIDHEGEPGLERLESTVDLKWTGFQPFPDWQSGVFSAVWKTTLTPPQSGIYRFVIEGANHTKIEIDGRFFIERWENEGYEMLEKSIDLQAGHTYEIGIWIHANRGENHVRFGWIPPWAEKHMQPQEELLRAVREADAVLFFGGSNHGNDVEGCDRRDMSLPAGCHFRRCKPVGKTARDVSKSSGELPGVRIERFRRRCLQLQGRGICWLPLVRRERDRAVVSVRPRTQLHAL